MRRAVGTRPALGYQHQDNGTYQYTAPEVDHEMSEFLLEPCRANAFQTGEAGADRNASAGQRGPQQEFQKPVEFGRCEVDHVSDSGRVKAGCHAIDRIDLSR